MTMAELPPETGEDVLAAERSHRLRKLARMRERGIEPYPVGYQRDHTAAQAREAFGALPADSETREEVRIAGRLMLIRRHGGLVFATLHDQTGEIQVLADRETLGHDAFAAVEELDRGDWVGAVGTVMTTHTGELTVRATEVRLLSKVLRPLPDKHRGLSDVDTRLRERYLDLLVNPETRRTFDIRSKVISEVRAVLVERGFIEVETPVLGDHADGAAARPFTTHHNALDIDMFMRIALELPLKRLVVGGFERVFEIGRVFRNEGLDTRHNPEFTLLEAYQALGDYHDMMDLVETISSRAALAATGTTVVQIDGRPVELAPPWRRVTMAELIEEHTGERMHPTMAIEEARGICDRLGIGYEPGWGAGRLMSEVYDDQCEHTLIEPTFVMDHPLEVSPLARTHRSDDTLVERFEAVIAGRELANAYTELNDPVDQKARFEIEAAAKAAGDVEAEDVDEDYIRALEYGLPPTGGLGIGLDRLVMLIANATAIREVILFPAMRPEGGEDAVEEPVAVTTPAPVAAPPVVVEREIVPASALPRRSAARLLGRLTMLAGLVLLLVGLTGLHDWLGIGGAINSADGHLAGHVAGAVAGLVLVLLGGPLARGKRRAWGVAVALFAVGAVAALFRGPDPITVVCAAAMLVALVWNRSAFTARPDPASLRDVVRFVPAYLGLVVVYGFAALLLMQDHVNERLTVGGMLETVFLGLAGADGPYTYTRRFGDVFGATLLLLGIVGLVLVSILAFRVIRGAAGAGDADRDRARELVHAYGRDTLDYFALRSDKSYFFSAAGDAMIAFAYLGGHALVSADPIGAPGSEARVLDEFLAYCRERGWQVAFLAVRERDMAIYKDRGFRGVYLGDEAIIRCDRFTLAGGAMKGVRSSVRRVERTCTFKLLLEKDASPTLREQLDAVRDRWRAGTAERGFTMELGGAVSAGREDLLLAVASDAEGRPLGFLRLVPCFGEDPGWSLDLMQHDPDAPNGMTEFLIAKTAMALGGQGYRRLSMNFAAWGRLFSPDVKLSAAQRAQRKVAQVLDPFFQITSLRDFNAKFDPEWEPRSIVVEDVESIPSVALLYASVEGFLRVPVIGSHLVPTVRAEAAS
jgi:lysyl-tRNA synthetase class 2